MDKEGKKKKKETKKNLMKDNKTKHLREVREGSPRRTLEVKKQGRNDHLNRRPSEMEIGYCPLLCNVEALQIKC